MFHYNLNTLEFLSFRALQPEFQSRTFSILEGRTSPLRYTIRNMLMLGYVGLKSGEIHWLGS